MEPTPEQARHFTYQRRNSLSTHEAHALVAHLLETGRSANRSCGGSWHSSANACKRFFGTPTVYSLCTKHKFYFGTKLSFSEHHNCSSSPNRSDYCRL